MTEQKQYPKVINYLEYNHQEHPGEFNTQESETIPNQAYTVKEVLLRFNNGTLPNIVQPVYYDDTDDFDNIDPTLDPAFDLADAENILKQININKEEREKQSLEEKEDEESNEEQNEEPTE